MPNSILKGLKKYNTFMKYYSYEEFASDTNKLIQKVKGFEPEAIIGIARGGLTLSHAVAEGLGIREVQTLRTELYDEDTKRSCISIHNTVTLEKITKVLVLDDIADSGDTLKAVMESLECGNPEIEFKSASLFYKKTSIYEPTFWINEAKVWIDFFWERDFK